MHCYDPDDYDRSGVHVDHDISKTKAWFLCLVCTLISLVIAWAVA